MAVLASHFNQQNFESAPVVIPSAGGVQIFVSGDVYPGVVDILVKGSDGIFRQYSNLATRISMAFFVDLLSGTEIKIRFTGCTSANAEVLQ